MYCFLYSNLLSVVMTHTCVCVCYLLLPPLLRGILLSSGLILSKAQWTPRRQTHSIAYIAHNSTHLHKDTAGLDLLTHSVLHKYTHP